MDLSFGIVCSCFLERALGIRQGELGALRWLECDFDNMRISVPTLVLLASEGKPEEHKNGSIRKTTVDASKPEAFLTGVEVAKPTGNFVFPSERLRGSKPLDPASVLRKKIQPAFRRIGITVWAGTPFGTRWNYAGGDGRTSAHNPRLLAAQQPSSHEQVLAGNIEDQRLAQDKLVDSILPTGILPKTNLIQ